MKMYQGIRIGKATSVLVDNGYLDPRFDLKDFTGKRLPRANPDANDFEWGSTEGAAKQLAFAILLDHGLSVDEINSVLDRFLVQVVSWLPEDQWVLTTEEIEARLREVEASPVQY